MPDHWLQAHVLDERLRREYAVEWVLVCARHPAGKAAVLNRDGQRLKLMLGDDAEKIFAKVVPCWELANPDLRTNLPGGRRADQNDCVAERQQVPGRCRKLRVAGEPPGKLQVFPTPPRRHTLPTGAVAGNMGLLKIISGFSRRFSTL